MKKSRMWTLAMALAAAIGGPVSIDSDSLDEIVPEITEAQKSEAKSVINYQTDSLQEIPRRD